MDELVIKAMAKWPNVPACYGWLMLDARGAWRMRDEATQAADAPGERIVHEALVGFINRNYLADAQGRWYFQNGPQRVFVNLEAAPYIARTGAKGTFQLHAGTALEGIDAGWFSATGQLYLQWDGGVALVEDRDLVECLPYLRLDGQPVADATLLDWIAEAAQGNLTLAHGDRAVPIHRLGATDPAQHFGFVRRPQAEAAAR